MPSFSASFRDHVLPRLRQHIEIDAGLIALNERRFDDAAAFILRLALHAGASHLPDEQFADLEDWIAAQLTLEIAEWEAVA
jgi:hypothetical protein